MSEFHSSPRDQDPDWQAYADAGYPGDPDNSIEHEPFQNEADIELALYNRLENLRRNGGDSQAAER